MRGHDAAVQPDSEAEGMSTSSDTGQGVLDMFGRRRNDTEEAKSGEEEGSGEMSEQEETGAETSLDVPSREPARAASPTPAAVVPARPARRVSTPAAEPTRRITPGADSEGKCLLVGRSISLNGQIQSCEKLIVEGSVETRMEGCRELEVARTGVFKGDADVETAEISGTVEGSLVVRETLIVRASGRVLGTVSYGQLEVERGGVIIGEVHPCSEDDSREAIPVLAAESPVG